MRKFEIVDIQRSEIAGDFSRHLSMLSKGLKRSFGGFDVGKRRDLSVIPAMAEKMAGALLRHIVFIDGEGNEVDDAVIVGIVTDVLRRVSDHDAFALTQIDPSIKDPVRGALAGAIADALLLSYSAWRCMEKMSDGKEIACRRLPGKSLRQAHG